MTLFQQRKTSKVLSTQPLESAFSTQIRNDLINAAAYAPFHYPASPEHRRQLADNAPEPWRIYSLDHNRCVDLRQYLIAREDMSKVPDMLAAASLTLMVTWCPNPPTRGHQIPPDCAYYPSPTNMEHIAATAAAIQNLLLCATEKAIPTYWSSGGPLRAPAVFQLLGIPCNQILLGAVFLFPHNIQALENGESIKIVAGKMRDKRSARQSWCIDIKKM